jgi:uncharacterized integral membrane protein
MAEATGNRSDRATQDTGFPVTPRLVLAIVLGVVLLAFVVANWQSVEVHLLVTTVTAPLWLVLAVVIVLAFAAGLLVGRRRKNPDR